MIHHTCEHCLNAYNSPYSHEVFCVNKEFQQQFTPDINTTVRRDETCGTWSERKTDQKSLIFSQPIQLLLFDNL